MVWAPLVTRESDVDPAGELTATELDPVAIENLSQNALDIWQDIVALEVPLDIRAVVADLPPGQLAEARPTKFDDQGRPVGGTLIIDVNASGRGWFIDDTPADHGEFTVSLSEVAFRACW